MSAEGAIVPEKNAPESGTVSNDVELIQLIRDGHAEAFTELWHLYHPKLVGSIRRFTGYDPDEIAQETFARVYVQLTNGGGPHGAFMPYAIRTARNIATDMARRGENSRSSSWDHETLETLASTHSDHGDDVDEADLVQRAFHALPSSWKEALWWRDVNELSVKEVAVKIQKSEDSAATMIRRAREGMKQSWIAVHLTPFERLSDECSWTVSRLPKYHRGRLNVDDDLRVATHINECGRCDAESRTAGAVRASLASILALVGLGFTSTWAVGDPGGRKSALASVRTVMTLAAVTVGVAAITLLGLVSEPAPPPRHDEIPRAVPTTLHTGASPSEDNNAGDTAPPPTEPAVPSYTAEPAPVPTPAQLPAMPAAPAATPAPAPSLLTVTPRQGGLSGTATPGAEVSITVTQGSAQIVQETVPVLTDGSWVYHMPAGLTGSFSLRVIELVDGLQLSPEYTVGWAIG